jgi:ABC-type nickel/cobalt efflux system permease component RcnA
MGIWLELGIFLLVLAFGVWQIHDVASERRKRNHQSDKG